MNNLISFGLPTYNRAHLIEETLDYYYNVLHLGEYELHVSDNCSTDNTVEIIKKWQENHPNLKLTIQKENIGADGNMHFLQNANEAEYFMLLGDGVRFNKKELEEIINVVKSRKYDIVCFNYFNRSKTPTKEYRDKDLMLAEIGWYIAQMSSFIVKKEINVFTKDWPKLYKGTEFNYFTRMWFYLANHEFIAYWMNIDAMHFSLIPKKNSWQNRTPQVWIGDYVSSVMSLPANYALSAKKASLKESSKYYFFSLSNIAALIYNGFFTKKQMKSLRVNMSFILPSNYYFYIFLGSLPKGILKLLIFSVNLPKRVWNKIRNILKF